MSELRQGKDVPPEAQHTVLNVYIWNDLEQVSCNYHSEGGLVVIAETLDECLEVVSEDKYIKIDKEPDAVIPTSSRVREKKYFVFPNAGCC